MKFAAALSSLHALLPLPVLLLLSPLLLLLLVLLVFKLMRASSDALPGPVSQPHTLLAARPGFGAVAEERKRSRALTCRAKKYLTCRGNRVPVKVQ